MSWAATACRATLPLATPVSKNKPVTSSTPSIIPMGTPDPTAAKQPEVTARLTDTPQPAGTLMPAETITAVVTCFTTYYDPIAFMPDNTRILVRADSGVQIFDLQTMKEEGFLNAPSNLNGPAVALSPDGGLLAWALGDNSIQLIRLSDKKIMSTLVEHSGPVTKLKFSPDGGRLFSASHDGWVMEWDTHGKQLAAFQPGGAEVVGIGISADGARLATVPSDGPVEIWDTANHSRVRELGGSGGYDTSDVAFSTDGRFVAADLATGFYLWNASDGANLLGGDPGINSMAFAFSPDGRYLAYADIGANNAVMLRSPDGKQKYKSLEGHQSPVFTLVFSPDGSLLASADDAEIRIWQVEEGRLLSVGKSVCP
jgi:WD40 repeat protein